MDDKDPQYSLQERQNEFRHCEDLLQKNRERLRVLEQQQTTKGVDTEAHIIIEIDQIRTKIKGLEQQQQSLLKKLVDGRFIDQSNEIEKHLKNFVGRESEIREIENQIKIKGHQGGYIVLTGMEGQGKTALIAHLVNRDDIEKSIYHLVPDNPDNREYVSLVRNITAQLILKYKVYKEIDFNDIKLLESQFSELLDLLSSQGNLIVIFIDGVDRFFERSKDTGGIGLFTKLPPQNVVFLISMTLSRKSPSSNLKQNMYFIEDKRSFELKLLRRADFDLFLQKIGLHTVKEWADFVHKNSATTKVLLQHAKLVRELIPSQMTKPPPVEDKVLPPQYPPSPPAPQTTKPASVKAPLLKPTPPPAPQSGLTPFALRSLSNLSPALLLYGLSIMFILLALFVLPFLNFSGSQDQLPSIPDESLSLLRRKQISSLASFLINDGKTLPFLVWVIAALLLMTMILCSTLLVSKFLQQNKYVVWIQWLLLGVAVLAFTLLIWLSNELRDLLLSSLPQSVVSFSIQFHLGFGFWMCLVGVVLSIVGGILQFIYRDVPATLSP